MNSVMAPDPRYARPGRRNVVVGLLIYYVGRAVRRRQGIDVDLVYPELPPD